MSELKDSISIFSKIREIIIPGFSSWVSEKQTVSNKTGKINESIYINNNIGDITLMVNDNIENYKVNTTNIIGSVLINGKNNENVNNGDKMISVKNIVGSISVNF